jgi:hypothetical protein
MNNNFRIENEKKLVIEDCISHQKEKHRIKALKISKNCYPHKNINLLIYHLQCMRQFRIQELEKCLIA